MKIKKKPSVNCIWPGCLSEALYKKDGKPYCNGHMDSLNLKIELNNALARVKDLEKQLVSCRKVALKVRTFD